MQSKLILLNNYSTTTFEIDEKQFETQLGLALVAPKKVVEKVPRKQNIFCFSLVIQSDAKVCNLYNKSNISKHF